MAQLQPVRNHNSLSTATQSNALYVAICKALLGDYEYVNV